MLVTLAFAQEGQQERGWYLVQRGDYAEGEITYPELDPAVATSLWPESEFENLYAFSSAAGSSAIDWSEARRDPFSVFDHVRDPRSAPVATTSCFVRDALTVIGGPS